MSNRREQQASTDLGASLGASTAQAIDQMIRWPFWFTGATMDLMLQGMERLTGQTNWAMGGNGPRGGGNGGSMSTRGSGSAGMNVGAGGSGSSWSAGMNVDAGQEQGQSQGSASTGDDQDLSGDDLKYVLWSIVFCKPGYEAVLEPLQSDLVGYNADGASYAAVKIAKYLEKARNGRTERPQLWAEKDYPQGSSASRREPANIVGGNQTGSSERGWRIPADDHKYIKFVYRVERRFPKEEPEVTRIERVTIERGTETTRHTSVA